ncbi:hypothetical protein Hanom_Chr05g00404581 [Helianthus anomalus]
MQTFTAHTRCKNTNRQNENPNCRHCRKKIPCFSDQNLFHTFSESKVAKRYCRRKI